MDGRCAVETWAEFGLAGTSCKPHVRVGSGTDVILCTGSDEVYVFSTQRRKPTAVLLFPASVSHLVESHDNQLLYVACSSGVYCVSQQFLQSKVHSSPPDASSGPAELKISSEFLVVPEEEVLSLLLVGSVLLTLSQRDSSWVLTLHSAPASSDHKTLASFSLPKVLGVPHNDMEGTTRMKRRPVLICVHCGETASPSSSASSSSGPALPEGHVRLQPVLFKLLFGVDAALTKSPVILSGLPDGRLCVLPLRLPGSRLRVLHSLEQPVVFVGASVVMEAGQGDAQCLVAVGELGRMVLIKMDKGGPEEGCHTARFIERCVPGPVMCGCMDKNCLYYSTGSDLLRLDLSKESPGIDGQDRDEETSSKNRCAPQSPTSLNVCRVIALAELKYAAGEVQLLGLTVRGQLQRITLSAGTEGAESSKAPSPQVGRNARDLLSAIGDVFDRASTLKTAIKSKNQVLRHLNQVLNISFLLITSTNGEGKPIRCRALTKWSRLLQKDSLNLTCVLDNSSPYVLERGWTLSVTVFPLSYSPGEGGESPSTTFSFPFQNLHPGGKLEVSLPLAAEGDVSFPATVGCSLIFSLSSLLGEEAANPPESQSSHITLPLNTLTVDWLHALRVMGPIAAQEKVTSQSNSTTDKDTVRAFLRSRRIACSGRGEGRGAGASKPEQEQYSTIIRVSSELLRDVLVLKSSGLAPPNICLSLLEWLLYEGPGEVKPGDQGDNISSSVVHARGPGGHIVKLTTKEVNVGEESRGVEESLNSVEVQVESSSLAAVCGLHHAVLRRVQTLLQRATETPASSKRAQSLGLRQALQRAERLSQQIQQIRVSGAFSVGASSGQMTQSLLSIYQELRENPLLII